MILLPIALILLGAYANMEPVRGLTRDRDQLGG
jgi:hypothetical protein